MKPLKCEGKQSFDNRGDADFVAARTRSRGYGQTMKAYRCPECSKFHVGHQVSQKKPGKFRFKMRRR